jgi:hypothetical protein
MANAKGPLDLAETDSHPPGTSAALEALDHRGGCLLDAETVRQFSRAVFLRPGRKPWTPEQARQVAGILDRAAREIEQIG